MMGGDIWIESKEGQGASFYFNIYAEKLADEDDKPIKFKPIKIKLVEDSPIATDGLSILMAEDIKMNQVLVQKILNKIGHTDIDFACNMELAIEAMKRKNYDVILMDIHANYGWL